MEQKQLAQEVMELKTQVGELEALVMVLWANTAKDNPNMAKAYHTVRKAGFEVAFTGLEKKYPEVSFFAFPEKKP